MNQLSSAAANCGGNHAAHKDPSPKILESQPWVRLDFSRAKWYTLMYRHGAPKPIKFGRSARWVPAEVDAWVQQIRKSEGATK